MRYNITAEITDTGLNTKEVKNFIICTGAKRSETAVHRFNTIASMLTARCPERHYKVINIEKL